MKSKLGRGSSVPQFGCQLMLFQDSRRSGMAGFPWHPHRGIETVTYIIEGPVEHQDSIGNKGVIGAGDVQWMTAGSGIIHQEMPQKFEGETKGFQLWVNLPKEHKMMKPRYRGITSTEIPVVKEEDVTVKIIAGTYADAQGPVTDLVVDSIYLDVTLVANKKLEYTIPTHYTAFLYIFEGSLEVGDSDTIGEGIVVLTDGGDMVSVVAGDKAARFLLIAGEPIGEPAPPKEAEPEAQPQKQESSHEGQKAQNGELPDAQDAESAEEEEK